MERHADNLWTARSPRTFLGLHLGTRMTVVRLRDGSLLVHSPIGLDTELRAEVDSLGEVRHIVAPNLFHHVYAGEWQAAYPGALLHAPPGLEEKRRDLAIDRQLGDDVDPEWASDLELVDFAGTIFGETVFFHPSSRSLIVADAIENFETSPHWPTRMYLKLCGIHGQPGVSRPLRLGYRDKKAARRSVDEILSWDFDRILLPHGDPIETGGAHAFRKAYAWLKG